jgi:hypothetical protein
MRIAPSTFRALLTISSSNPPDVDHQILGLLFEHPSGCCEEKTYGAKAKITASIMKLESPKWTRRTDELKALQAVLERAGQTITAI